VRSIAVPTGESTDIIGLDTVHDEAYRRGPVRITAIRWLDSQDRPATAIKTWDALRLEVDYVCPDAETLEGTLGLSLAINRRSDLLSIATFSTVNPVRDIDLATYDAAPYRKRAGRYGRITCAFPHFELLEGEYLLSLGLQQNIPSTSDFYEYHHLRFILRVIRNGYPSGSVFQPDIEWSHALFVQ
jgi:Wzt C-terminal domain